MNILLILLIFLHFTFYGISADGKCDSDDENIVWACSKNEDNTANVTIDCLKNKNNDAVSTSYKKNAKIYLFLIFFSSPQKYNYGLRNSRRK